MSGGHFVTVVTITTKFISLLMNWKMRFSKMVRNVKMVDTMVKSIILLLTRNYRISKRTTAKNEKDGRDYEAH